MFMGPTGAVLKAIFLCPTGDNQVVQLQSSVQELAPSRKIISGDKRCAPGKRQKSH